MTTKFLPSPTSLSLPIWPFSVGQGLGQGPLSFFAKKDDLCRNVGRVLACNKLGRNLKSKLVLRYLRHIYKICKLEKQKEADVGASSIM